MVPLGRCGVWLLMTSLMVIARAVSQEAPKDSREQPKAGVIVLDTGRSHAEPIPPEVLRAASGWMKVPTGTPEASFKGDAVVSNGPLWVVFRRSGVAVEVYSFGNEGTSVRALLALEASAGGVARRLVRVAVIEYSRSSACIEAVYATPEASEVAARFRIRKGEASVEVQQVTGARRLRVECPARFLVVPDFFADDIVISAATIPLAQTEVPSENFYMHLAGSGDGMVVCVYEEREQEVMVSLSGQEGNRVITESAVPFGKAGKKVWVTPVAGPRLWHAVELDAPDAKKIVPLAWKMPFVAQWRVNFTRTNGLTDSWDMLLQEKQGGDYLKPSWLGNGADSMLPDADQARKIDPGTFGRGTGSARVGADRKRWSTVLGNYYYPCWTDPEGRGYLQPWGHPALAFRGPVLVYPLSRIPATSPDVYTLLDIVRNTLGVGPCEHILDLEGQKHEYKGRATCAASSALHLIFGQGQHRQKREEVEAILKDALAFVTHIRHRIDRYVEFGRKMRAYLAEEAARQPELKSCFDELDKILQEMDKRYSGREKHIRSPEYVAQMNEEFRKSVFGDEVPDTVERCKKYGRELVGIGGMQDELAGECRWAVKSLRQRAGLLVAMEPRFGKAATEVRARAQEVLRNPAVHEGARH